MQDDEDGDWFRLIKSIRAQRGVGILEAEKIAVQEPKWRRWLERRINIDRKCRKLALYDMRLNGAESLICWEGERLVVRSDTQTPTE